MKKKKRTFYNIGKEKYDFDINLEKDIYSYLYALGSKQNKSLDDKLKFEYYREWKQYIENKYKNFDSNKLMEFSKYLNCAIGDEKSTFTYWNIGIPILLTILFTKMPEMINELNSLEFEGHILFAIIFIVIVLIGIVASTIYMLCKFVTPLFESNIRENMLFCYKELIDDMYMEKKAEEQKYEQFQQITKNTIEVEIIYNQMDEAISVMREVAAWGREKGFRVWLDEWLTPEELLTEDTQPKNFCIGKVNGEIACAFILQKSDKEYWRDATENEAVYLHKLCVRRKFAHQGMTNAVLAAIREECKKDGVKFIRLDTGLDEKVVRKIYLNAGCKIVDTIDYDNGKSLALYELEV